MKAALCVFLKHIFQLLCNHHVSTLQHIKMFLKNSQRPDHILWNTKFHMSTYKRNNMSSNWKFCEIFIFGKKPSTNGVYPYGVHY
jgi:hypothetical protein